MNKPTAPFERVVTMGAVGGRPARSFPTTTVESVFTKPLPNRGLQGIANRLVHRPTGAPALPSAAFHTNAAWARPTIKGMETTRFPGFPITTAVHLLGQTHATLRRKVLRGT